MHVWPCRVQCQAVNPVLEIYIQKDQMPEGKTNTSSAMNKSRTPDLSTTKNSNNRLGPALTKRPASLARLKNVEIVLAGKLEGRSARFSAELVYITIFVLVIFTSTVPPWLTGNDSA
jgi:hypothetical protein